MGCVAAGLVEWCVEHVEKPIRHALGYLGHGVTLMDLPVYSGEQPQTLRGSQASIQDSSRTHRLKWMGLPGSPTGKALSPDSWQFCKPLGGTKMPELAAFPPSLPLTSDGRASFTQKDP
jgi:hypothetical protein